MIQMSWIRIPLLARIFQFVILGFRSLQPELAHSNKINLNIHLSQHPVLDKGSLEKYSCRLQWYITDHLSFNTEKYARSVNSVNNNTGKVIICLSCTFNLIDSKSSRY